MKNKIINLYIPNWVPCSENKKLFNQIIDKTNALNIFEWKINFNQTEETNNKFSLEPLNEQIINYFNKLDKNTLVNLFVSTFSQFIIVQIYDQIKEHINQLIFINPLDEHIYRKMLTIKKKMLPLSNHDAIYKYIFLSKTLDNFRYNETWLKNVHNEVNLIKENDLIFHKMFDQMLRVNSLKYYLFWIHANSNWLKIIISSDNPLIKTTNWNLYNHDLLYKIEDCGFCIWLEKPENLNQIMNLIIQEN